MHALRTFSFFTSISENKKGNVFIDLMVDKLKGEEFIAVSIPFKVDSAGKEAEIVTRCINVETYNNKG